MKKSGGIILEAKEISLPFVEPTKPTNRGVNWTDVYVKRYLCPCCNRKGLYFKPTRESYVDGGDYIAADFKCMFKKLKRKSKRIVRKMIGTRHKKRVNCAEDFTIDSIISANQELTSNPPRPKLFTNDGTRI